MCFVKVNPFCEIFEKIVQIFDKMDQREKIQKTNGTPEYEINSHINSFPIFIIHEVMLIPKIWHKT